MSISYELAKELKEAGFPQGRIGYISYYPDNQKKVSGISEVMVTTSISEPLDRGYYVPTLSELIDACGDSFGKLERIKMPSGMINWIALEPINHQTIPIMNSCETPEESVARLWLALNKN